MSVKPIASEEETKMQRLSQHLRASVLPLWRRQVHHPFVVALGQGTLPRANFEFYIRQDALFLDVLTKAFAYAVTKTADTAEMVQFGTYLLDTLQVEAALHRSYGERFGLTPAEMAQTPMAPTNYAYTRHLLAIAATDTLPALLAAVLPCAWIYAEVGQHLTSTVTPAPDHPYADWLATYASPDFDAVRIWLCERLDSRAEQLSAQEEAHLQEIFQISTRYEWLFWEMAWQLEAWPV
jgi:thiaminase/transcriptional activator TenA